MAKLKYGNIGLLGEPLFVGKAEMYTAVVLSAKSGRYVVNDLSDTYWRAVATNEAGVTGYIDQHLTCSSTSGNTVLPVAMNVNEFATEMPYSESDAAVALTAAKLLAAIGTYGDSYVGSNIQYFDTATSQTIYRCVGGDVAESTVYVVIPDAKIIHID